MDDAGRRDRIGLIKKERPFVVHHQVGAEGKDDAVGRYEQRPAVRPIRARLLHGLTEKREVVGKNKIVMGGESDQLSARLAESYVAVGIAEVRCLGQVEPADALIAEAFHDLGGTVRAPVADDKQFEIGFALQENRTNGKTDNVRPVVGRHEDAEAHSSAARASE